MRSGMTSKNWADHPSQCRLDELRSPRRRLTRAFEALELPMPVATMRLPNANSTIEPSPYSTCGRLSMEDQAQRTSLPNFFSLKYSSGDTDEG